MVGRADGSGVRRGLGHGVNSALYVGRVRHHRVSPKAHRLSYRVWHLLLDLDELPELDRQIAGFGHNRRAMVEFRDADHFGTSPEPVRDKLAALLAARHVAMPTGQVQVLTYPRVLGFVFNPVSFWYLHDADGELAVVVAEVNNTFGDSWSYILDDLVDLPGGALKAEAFKVLHVSPFLPVENHDYTFAILPPSTSASSNQAVHMTVADEHGIKLLGANLVEARRTLSSRALARVMCTHPLVTLHTVVGIHWHALRMFLGRKARFHHRPAAPTR